MIHMAVAVLRGFLMLCGAVVLGLSVTLAKHQLNGSVPSETGFSAFAGGFGIIASVVGVAALFLDSLPAFISMGVDALAAVFYLSGGIAMAIALKGVSCSGDVIDSYIRGTNKLLNGGCVVYNGDNIVCGISNVGGSQAIDNELKARCTRASVDYAFEFVACAFCIGALLVAFMLSRRSGKAVFA